MPRFMVERTFKDGLHIPGNDAGAIKCLTVVGKNAANGVTWVHSYVSADKSKTYCIYDGPDEAAIRASAEQAGLPVDSVTPVSVLDPYFYHDS
jgi:8-oxo-dGTP pyrophosphatase MutT (NUDIX family)